MQFIGMLKGMWYDNRLVTYIGRLFTVLVTFTCSAGLQASSIFTESSLTQTASVYQRLSSTPSASLSSEQRLVLAETQYFLNLTGPFMETVSRLEASQLETPKERVVALYFAAMRSANRGLFTQAIDELTEALAKPEVNRSQPFQALFLQERAYYWSILENHDKALLDLKIAYELATRSHDPLALGLVEQSLGAVYYYAGDFNLSINYYRKALQRYIDANYQPLVASTHLGIASTHRELGDFNDAIKAYAEYEQALAYQESLGSKFYLHYGRAIALSSAGKCEAALVDIERALNEDGPLDYYTELYKSQIQCALLINDLANARKAYVNARELFDRQPELIGTLWEIELAYLQAKLNAAEGNQTRAIELYEQYIGEYQHASNKKLSESLADLKLQFEADQKNLEIELLEQRSKYQTALIIMVVLIAVILLLAALRLRRKSERFYRDSTTDALTGTYNRRYAFNTMSTWLSAMRGDGDRWCIALLDIDNFKAINDKYGHQTGDRVLVVAAELVTKALRGSDLIARFGGEEFIIALRHTDCKTALSLLQTMVESIAAEQIEVGIGHRISFTVSIGVAAVTNNKKSIDDWVAIADKRLYAAKRKGKNCVVGE